MVRFRWLDMDFLSPAEKTCKVVALSVFSDLFDVVMLHFLSFEVLQGASFTNSRDSMLHAHYSLFRWYASGCQPDTVFNMHSLQESASIKSQSQG